MNTRPFPPPPPPPPPTFNNWKKRPGDDAKFGGSRCEQPSPSKFSSNEVYNQGFFQDFRQEGANVTIVELRGGMYYCCIFQGFCHRGNVIAHS